MRCVQMDEKKKELIAEAEKEYEQAVFEADAVTVVESGSDEESTNKVVVLPSQLTMQPSPGKKKKRGGQVKGRGRSRAKPMVFDEFNGENFTELDKLAKERFEISAMDMVEFFKQKKYDGEIGGILADLPYATQASDHGRDPPISGETANQIAQGMWRVGADRLVVILGCGSIEQVLLLSLLLKPHTQCHTHTHTHIGCAVASGLAGGGFYA